MKKVLFLAITLMFMVVAQAQIQEDLLKSKERVENLKTLCENYPKPCGSANIDAYGKSVHEAALLAISNSKQLEKFYNAQVGNGEKPTLNDWIKLGETIAEEGIAIKKAADGAEGAAKEVKELGEAASKEKNPMKLAKAAKTAKNASAILDFSTKAVPVLVEESAAQAVMVQQMIDSLKK